MAKEANVSRKMPTGVYRRAPDTMNEHIAYMRLDGECSLHYSKHGRAKNHWVIAPVKSEGDKFYAVLSQGQWLEECPSCLRSLPLQIGVHVWLDVRERLPIFDMALGSRVVFSEVDINGTNSVEPLPVYSCEAEESCKWVQISDICKAEGPLACVRIPNGVKLRTAFFQRFFDLAMMMGLKWYESNQIQLASVAHPRYSAFMLAVPNKPHAVFCVPPKNGCTLWKRLVLRAEGWEHWNSEESYKIHDPTMNGLRFLSSLSLAELQNVMNSPRSILKIIIVRSPVVRALSVFLASRSLPNARAQWPDFASFVGWLSTVDAFLDPHTRPQSAFCDLWHGAHFDFVGKVESRQTWMPRLFNMLALGEFVESGWGIDGKSAFYSEAASEAGGVRALDQSSKTGESKVTKAESRVCKFYTKKLLLQVARIYQEDLRLFRYAGEISSWRRRCNL